MALRKCKNDICKKTLENSKLLFLPKIIKNDKELYFCCNECCNVYKQKEEQKEVIKKQKDDITEFVKLHIFGYDSKQKLSKYFYTKLDEFSSYGYDIILLCIEECYQDIVTMFKIKNITKENNRVSYMMAVISNRINDVYERHKRIVKSLEKELKQDISIQIPTTPIFDMNKINNEKKGIADWLGEDD